MYKDIPQICLNKNGYSVRVLSLILNDVPGRHCGFEGLIVGVISWFYKVFVTSTVDLLAFCYLDRGVSHMLPCINFFSVGLLILYSKGFEHRDGPAPAPPVGASAC